MATRKEVLRRRGVLADASLRAPAIGLDDGTRQALDRLLAWTAAQAEVDWM
jgi:dihydrodipicolinate synthase/N-acetylneuraminate lyase